MNWIVDGGVGGSKSIHWLLFHEIAVEVSEV